MFTAALRLYYEHQELPGHAFVMRGDYQIVLAGDHRTIEEVEWGTMIRPDSKVAMSMILRRHGDAMNKCPRCGAAPENEEVGGWANWSVIRRFNGMITDKGYSSSCPGHFRTTVREDNVEELVSPAVNADHDVDPSEESVPERRTTTSRQDTSEVVWKRFRLLSIISLVRRISDPTVKVDEGPKKRCQKCGRTGRYEHGKCIEKWGPGPQDSEICCEECSQWPDPPKDGNKDTRKNTKDFNKGIKDSDLRKFIDKKYNAIFNKGSVSSTTSVENNPDSTPTPVPPSDPSFLRSPPLLSPFTFNPGYKPPGAPMGTSPIESSSLASSSSHYYPHISSFPTIAPLHGYPVYNNGDSIDTTQYALDAMSSKIKSGGGHEAEQSAMSLDTNTVLRKPTIGSTDRPPLSKRRKRPSLSEPKRNVLVTAPSGTQSLGYRQLLVQRLTKYRLKASFHVEQKGPQHAQQWRAAFSIGSHMLGQSSWCSYKDMAKEEAAKHALDWMTQYGYE
jgi:hypothetical protein